VSLSLREKQNLYHSLSQLLRAGVALPGALTSLAKSSSGKERHLLQRLNKSVNAGKTVGESIAALRPDVSDLEVGAIAACEKSGRLEYGLNVLAGYFESLALARERILARCAYPLFVLHFGVLALNAPTLIVGGGLTPYLRQVGGTLGLFWAVILVGFLLFPLLRDAGAGGPGLDAFLRRIPLLGKVRTCFATSRFCATYEMQLDAGINVIDALETAQRASQSGLIKQAVRRAIPEVRDGAQVGPLLADSGALPEPVVRAIMVGEQTGQLDQELVRMTKEYQDKGVARLETIAEWVPRLFYVCILLYVAFRVVVILMGIYGPNGVYRQLIDGM
jgi:type II secretory pathway component PulF